MFDYLQILLLLFFFCKINVFPVTLIFNLIERISQNENPFYLQINFIFNGNNFPYVSRAKHSAKKEKKYIITKVH